jgi:hypothetical protein
MAENKQASGARTPNPESQTAASERPEASREHP